MAETVLAKMAVQIAANTAQFNQGLKGAQAQFSAFTSSITKIGGVLGAAFGASQLFNFGRQVIDITAKFQKFQAVLTNTLGSRSAALGAMDDIQEFAAKTPFSVDELTASFVKLVNQGFKPTTKEMTALGDLAASQGKSFNQLTEAIIDAQTGEFERLKEFGIRAKKEGDNVSFTFKGVKTQVDFTADSIRKYILSLGSASGVSGGMAAISETLGGKLSNLGDNFDQILVAIGDRSSGLVSGVLDLANNAMGSLNSALNDQTRKLQSEQIELNGLVGAITDTNTSEEVRKKLISDLNRLYPDFLKNLDAETVTNEQLNNRLKDVNEQFQRKILLVAAEKELAKVSEEIIKQVNREADARIRLQKIRQGNGEAGPVTGFTFTTNQQQLTAQQLTLEESINNAVSARSTLQSELNDRMRAYNEALGIFNTTGNDYFVQTEANSTATDKFIEKLKSLKDSLKFKVKISTEDASDPDVFKNAVKDLENPNIELGLDEEAFEKINDEFFIPFNEAWRKAHETTEENTQAIRDSLANFKEGLNEVDITGLVAGSIASLAESLGEAAAGVGNFGKSILNAIAGFAKQLGAILIATGIAKISFDKFKGPAMVAAGAALIAVASAASAFMNKSSSVGSGSGSGSSVTQSNSGNRPLGDNTRSQEIKLTVEPFAFRGSDVWLMLKSYERNSNYTSSVNG